MPQKKVHAGQPLSLSADFVNRLVDGLAAEGRANGGAPPGRDRVGTILVQAASYAVPRFGVVSIFRPRIDPAINLDEFKSARVMWGDLPGGSNWQSSGAATAAMIAIVQEPIAAGAIGAAMAVGVTPAKVKITDAAHAFAAGLAGDNTQLVSAAAGPCQILWREPVTGLTLPQTKWAVVRIAVPSLTPTPTLGIGAAGAASAGSGQRILSFGSLLSRGNMAVTGGDRWTIPAAGIYQIDATVMCDMAAASPEPIFAILKNGSQIVMSVYDTLSSVASRKRTTTFGTAASLFAADYLQFRVDSGVTSMNAFLKAFNVVKLGD